MIICIPSLLVFQEHFLEVIQNQEFLLLPTAEIVKLLSSDDLNVPDEETIFQALMMWVRYDVQSRQQDLGVLLAYIRLPLLPPQVRGARGMEDVCGSRTFSGSAMCHFVKPYLSCWGIQGLKAMPPKRNRSRSLFIYFLSYSFIFSLICNVIRFSFHHNWEMQMEKL